MQWSATVYTKDDFQFDYTVEADSYQDAQSAAFDRFDAQKGTAYGDVQTIMVAPLD